jgi:hypothetical protein
MVLQYEHNITQQLISTMESPILCSFSPWIVFYFLSLWQCSCCCWPIINWRCVLWRESFFLGIYCRMLNIDQLVQLRDLRTYESLGRLMCHQTLNMFQSTIPTWNQCIVWYFSISRQRSHHLWTTLCHSYKPLFRARTGRANDKTKRSQTIKNSTIIFDIVINQIYSNFLIICNYWVILRIKLF